MVAYTENKEYENKGNEMGNKLDSKAYRNLFVRDALEPRDLYPSQDIGDSYLRNRKNKEQRKYRAEREKVDPLELLASIPSIRSYGFVSIPSLRSGGNYDGSREGYSSSRAAADGDYSDGNTSYAAADSGNAESYSVN